MSTIVTNRIAKFYITNTIFLFSIYSDYIVIILVNKILKIISTIVISIIVKINIKEDILELSCI